MIKLNLSDVPNTRSSHKIPTARGGGMAIYLAFVITLSIFYACFNVSQFQYVTMNNVLKVVTCCVCLGIIDDIKSTPAWLRLFIQLLCATVLIRITGEADLENVFDDKKFMHLFEHIGYILSILWFVGYTNVYNFMDGINGISSGTAIIHLILIAVIAHQQHDHMIMHASIILVFACLGFMMYNFPKARLFLGDCGSYFLGMTIAVFSMQVAIPQTNSSILMLITLHFIYLFDTSTTICKRVYRRQNIFKAHREHLYQVLQNSGWSHAKVSSLYWGWAGVQICAVYACQQSSWKIQAVVLIVMLIAALCFTLFVRSKSLNQNVAHV